MSRTERRTPEAFERAGEDLKSVSKAGTAGLLLVTMIVLALIAIAVLGIALLFRG